MELDLASNLLEDNRFEILMATEQVFLSLCDQPLDMDTICGMYFRLDAPEPAVHIAVARAHVIDPNQRALAWYLSGSNSSDEIGEQLLLTLQRECYEPINNAIFSDIGRKAIEESNDQLLCYHVFDFLLNIGEIPLLLEFNSKYLEDFLRTFKRQILYQYYIKYCRFSDASKELLDLATTAKNVTLGQRIHWLQEAVNLAKKALSIQLPQNSQTLQLLKECQTALEAAQSHELLDSDEINKETLILDFPEQIEQAARAGDWKSVLRIEALQPVVDEEQRKRDVQKAWHKLLKDLQKKIEANSDPNDEDLRNGNLLAHQVESIIRSFPKSFITQGSIIVPVFEDFKKKNNYPLHWVGNLLGRLTSNLNDVFEAYANFINSYGFEKEVKYEYVVIAMQLIYKYNLGNSKTIEYAIDELLHDPDSQFFPEADKLNVYLEQREKRSIKN